MCSPSFAAVVTAVVGILAATSSAETPLTSLWPADACTDKSFTIPSWVIRDLNITGDGSAHFTMINRVTDLSSVQTCSTDEGSCTATGDGGDATVTAQITNGTLQVYIEDSWSCNDKKTLHGEAKTYVLFFPYREWLAGGGCCWLCKDIQGQWH